MSSQRITLIINYKEYQVEVEPYVTLAECLRNKLAFTGVKISCNAGDCGACTVLLEGEPICSCIKLAVQADGKSITTIEGLSKGEKLHPIQEAFIEHHGMQCGFCTPGMILSAKALLDRNPNRTVGIGEVREAISGNLCRCGSYTKIIESILAAAKRR